MTTFRFTQGAGGRFTGSSGGAPPAVNAWFQRLGGPMSYDPKANRGTGYGHRHGDPRVRALQEALNAAGIRDSHGRPLVVDGKLGPLTTSAIKSAQTRLGLKPDGVVTAALLMQIVSLPAAPAAVKKPVTAAKKMSPKKPGKPAVPAIARAPRIVHPGPRFE